jgi:hypothetical protein
MGFWPWKKRAVDGKGGLAAFDEALELLEKRGAELRRAAATLLATRAELQRRVDRLGEQLKDIKQRAETARIGRDLAGAQTLEADESDLRRLLHGAEEGLARADADASLLTEAAGELKNRQLQLQEERLLAQARVRAGEAVALAQRSAGLEWALTLRLEEARDEVEKAHALAAVYRENRGKR